MKTLIRATLWADAQGLLFWALMGLIAGLTCTL